MKLFKVGYAETTHLIVAENETESILKFINKYPNLSSLPLTSEQITDNEYEVVALDKEDLNKLSEFDSINDELDTIVNEYESFKAEYDKLKEYQELKDVKDIEESKKVEIQKTTTTSNAKRK